MPDTQADSVGTRIAHERGRLGVSQAALAAALGIHPVTIWRWENGRTNPSMALLVKIADALGMPVSALIPEDDSYFE